MSKEEIEPAFLSVTDTAKLFSVTTQTVREWINEGKLDAIKINPRMWRISYASIRKMVNELHGEPLEF